MRRGMSGLLGFFIIFAGTALGEGTLRVGTWAEDISPSKLPISLAGSMTDQRGMTIHDPLFARALVLDNGQTKLAFVLCDSCMIPRPLMDEAKKRIEESIGFPAANIIVSATHSHSCPTAGEAFQSSASPEYPEELITGIVRAVVKAASITAPAEIGFSSANCPSEVFNRRWRMKPGTIPADPFDNKNDQVQMNPPVGSANLIEPAGGTDPEVSVLVARLPEGAVRAVLANYSLHYVGGIPANAISADYFGEYARIMTSRLGAGKKSNAFLAMLTNGTSGDVNNINFRQARPPMEPFAQVRHVANEVANVSEAALKSVSFQKDAVLKSARKEIELGVRKPSAEDLARAKKILAESEGKPLTTLAQIYARETVLLADYPDTVKLWLQAVRVGSAGIVAIPCEVFTEIGLEIKSKSPLQPTFTIELANGYNGYLPTPRQHEWGGYETWRARSSYLEKDASTKIVDTALELLKEVARD